MRTFRIGKRRTGMIRQIRVMVGSHQRRLGEIRRCPRLLRSRCPRFWFKRSHRRWHKRWLRRRRSRHWRRTRRHRLYHGNRFYLQKWSQSRCQKPHYRCRYHFSTHRSDWAFHDTIAPRRMTVHMRKRQKQLCIQTKLTADFLVAGHRHDFFCITVARSEGMVLARRFNTAG